MFEVPLGKTSFKMWHDHGHYIEAIVFWHGIDAFESTTMVWWKKLSTQSKYIFDIGANTGFYTLIAKSLNPNAEIYAFEPIKRIYSTLDKNIKLNSFSAPPTVFAHRLALSDYSGKGNMFDLPEEHNYTATLNRNLYAECDPPLESITEPAEVMRFDDFIAKHRVAGCDLIKIDVESHEASVLRGMGDLLKNYHPTLIIEIWNNKVGFEVEEILKNCGYLYFTLEESTPSLVQHIRNNRPEAGYINFLVCTPAVAEDIGVV
tara:strand:+ start:2596 stop:3378 length:783 start_codon:yes stop_codon:yes gene_type:complete